jgi:hypothetical protein
MTQRICDITSRKSPNLLNSAPNYQLGQDRRCRDGRRTSGSFDPGVSEPVCFNAHRQSDPIEAHFIGYITDA